MRIARRKNGAIDIPFNWLFVMIAGGAILLSVFAFVQKQQKVYGEEISQTVLRDLSAITSGAQAAKGTSQIVDIPDSNIILSCTPECACGMTAGPVRIGLRDNLIFGQDTIKGTKMILWAQDWSLPVRVTNFLLLSTPRTKYYLLHRGPPNDKLAKAFKERIPDNVNITFVESSTLNPKTTSLKGRPIENLGFDAVRFIMLEDRPNQPLPSCQAHASFQQGDDVSCMAFRPDIRTSSITNAYDIAIYNRTGSAPHTYRVVGEATVIAAAFSDTHLQFECNMRRAYRRLGVIANLTSHRSHELEKLRTKPGSTLCPGIAYFSNEPAGASNPFRNLATEATRLSLLQDITNFITAPRTSHAADVSIKTIHESLATISTRNADLLRQDCPLLY